MRTQIGQKLEEGGEREKLKELLRLRLKECGWRDQLKEHCRGETRYALLLCTLPLALHCNSELISQKGLSNVTVDTLVQEITPKARSKSKLT